MPVGTPTSYIGGTNSTVIPVTSVVVGTGDLVVVGIVYVSDTITVDTIDFGTETDTFTILGTPEKNAGSYQAQVWYAKEGTISAGTQTVNINLSTSTPTRAVVAVFSGAGDAPDNYDTDQADSASADAAIDPTGATADNAFFDVFGGTGSGHVPVETGQTKLQDQGGGGVYIHSSWRDGNDGSAMGMSWSTSSTYAYAGCRIPEPATGGSIIPQIMYNRRMQQ